MVNSKNLVNKKYKKILLQLIKKCNENNIIKLYTISNSFQFNVKIGLF